MQTLSPQQFKNCCTALYEDRVLQFLLGPSLHPGGLALTKRLADKLKITPIDNVLDAACGLGETTRFLADHYRCRVLGLDLSAALVQRAASDHNSTNADFLVSDDERLPFRDKAFTAAISECSMCLMPELGAGLNEVFRTLGPGGRIGISDIATTGQLPSELEEVLMQFLCISNRIPLSEYPAAVETEGFQTVEMADESDCLRELLESIKKRLLLGELLVAVRKLSLDRDLLDRAKRLVSLARTSVDKGNLRYIVITAEKPNT